jgi:hypothetical protein
MTRGTGHSEISFEFSTKWLRKSGSHRHEILDPRPAARDGDRGPGGWVVGRSVPFGMVRRSDGASLRHLLDEADPGWRNRPAPSDRRMVIKPQLPPVIGLATGMGIFAVALLLIALVWKQKVHPSVLEDRRRI